MDIDPERLNSYSRELLKFLLSRKSHSVFCKDVNSHYFTCNDRFLVDCGLDSVTNIVGKSDYDLLWTKEEAAFYRLVDQEVLVGGVIKPKFVEAQTDYRGKQRWVETSKFPLVGLDGKILGLIGHYHQLD